MTSAEEHSRVLEEGGELSQGSRIERKQKKIEMPPIDSTLPVILLAFLFVSFGVYHNRNIPRSIKMFWERLKAQ